MKAPALAFFALSASALLAEQQPFERYQPIIDRQMFGQPPPNFDPAKPPSEAPRGGGRGTEEELTREQEVIKSSIHFSAINVTPDGSTAVGFTDNTNPKMPVHYYLKVGEERNGWKVAEADPVKATMTIVKDEVEVSLKLGANSGGKGGAKGGGNAAARDMAGRGLAAGQRAGLLGARRGGFAAGGTAGDAVRPGGSLRERRAQREQERAAEEAKEKAKREAEREEQRRELQLLKDELKAQRDAAEKERAEREAERAERAAREQNQAEANANDFN